MNSNENTIELTELKQVCDVIRRMDAIPLSDIEFTKKGNPVLLSDAEKEEWRLIGLSNTTMALFWFLGGGE